MKNTANIAGKYLQFSRIATGFKKIAEKIEILSETLTFYSFSKFFSVVLFGVSYCFLKKYSFKFT